MSFKDQLVSGKELISVKRRRSQTYVFDKFEHELRDKRISDGWEVHNVLKNEIKMKRPKPIDEQFEDEVWLLCDALGFTYLNKDRHLELTYGSPDTNTTKQIDVLAIDEETILIIECKCAKTGKKGSFKEEIEALHGIKGGISRTLKSTFKNRKIKCIFATKNYDVSEADSNRMKELGIQHFDHVAIKYFAELAKHLGKSARYQLLGHLFAGTKVPFDNKIPAIRGKMGGYTYYSFSIEPEKLLKIAYVLHRNEANDEMMPTYQRIIKKSRLSEIQKFIDKGGFFPNCIIVNIDADGGNLPFDLASLKDESSIAQLGMLHLPQRYRSAYVIDGQHRLYGYADSKYCSNNSIPVVAFINLSKSKQVELFMEINENQKTVSKNLKNTLNADLLWDSKDYNVQRKALRLKIATKLGEQPSSPLYERVIIGENEVNSTQCITLDTIDSALKMTNFFSKFSYDNLIITNGTFDKGSNDGTQKILLPFLKSCFEYIRDGLLEEWEKGERDQGILAINNSIYALIRIFNDIVNHLISKNKVNPQKDYPEEVAKEVSYYLAPLVDYFGSISEEQRKELKTKYGSGGKVFVWRTFQRIIAEYNMDFKPDGLEQWIKDNTKQYNVESHSMIRDIEDTIKNDFKNKLQNKYGDKWLTRGLPQKIYKQANSTMGKINYEVDISGTGNVVTIWDCVSIAHCREIATYGPHWTELFESSYTRPEELRIPGGKSAKTEWFMRLSKISNNDSSTSTSYSVPEEDYKFLKSLHEWLVK